MQALTKDNYGLRKKHQQPSILNSLLDPFNRCTNQIRNHGFLLTFIWCGCLLHRGRRLLLGVLLVIKIFDVFKRLLSIINDPVQINIILTYSALLSKHRPKIAIQRSPEIFTDQDNREGWNLFCLNQAQSFKQDIQNFCPSSENNQARLTMLYNGQFLNK